MQREHGHMHIDPIIPGFDFVTIRRTGGILGVDEMLQVDRRGGAVVSDRLRGDRLLTLDAYQSQELMSALATLVERAPAPSTRTGADLFHYDVELSIGGVTHRFQSVDLGADEALHGVMLAANGITRTDDHAIHPMTLHVTPEHA